MSKPPCGQPGARMRALLTEADEISRVMTRLAYYAGRVDERRRLRRAR